MALGSNLGDRAENLRRAIALLDGAAVRVVKVSGVYETAPVGYAGQGWFLNLALRAETALLPLQLLGACQKAERTLKRRRGLVNGPRSIDVDVIFYERSVIRSARLVVPHPRYAERRFVLAPLAELDADLRDPVTGRSVRAMLARVSEQAARRTEIRI